MWMIYLFQQRDRISAVLQPGGETGGGRGVVILCSLRDELRHGDLVRHDPIPKVKPRRSRTHRSGEGEAKFWGGRWRGKKNTEEGKKKKKKANNRGKMLAASRDPQHQSRGTAERG